MTSSDSQEVSKRNRRRWSKNEVEVSWTWGNTTGSPR